MTVAQIFDKFPYLTHGDVGTFNGEDGEFTIIENSGIRKIIDKQQIKFTLDAEAWGESRPVARGGQESSIACVVKATCTRTGISTLGSANHKTAHNGYEAEMAEKRAIGRLVRLLNNLHDDLTRDEVEKPSSSPKAWTPPASGKGRA